MTDDRSPRLVWTEDGAPRSDRFDDIYFSREDGLAESRAVFLAGSSLPEAWRGRPRFTVAELGFGTGLNIAALLDLWRREGPPDSRLPRSPTTVSYPSGSCMMKSCASATRAAASTSSSLAIGLA